MCLLTYLPEDTQPDVAALRKGAQCNPDGHGFAIVIPEYGEYGRILVRKSMNATKLIKDFERLRAAYPNGPALFHSRITTDGITDLYNCHPFMVAGDKRTVMGHNGIFPGSVRPAKGDKRSDTRIVAEVAASGFKLVTEVGRRMFGEWMGSSNKVVILTVDPDYDQYGYIVNEHCGDWHDGVWYSNGSFRGYKAAHTSNYYGTSWNQWEWCGVKECTSKVATVNPHTLRCTKCENCALCLTDPCECVLAPKGASQATATAIGGSPSKGATTITGTGWVAEYQRDARALMGDDGDPEDDNEGPTESQLAQVLALVRHANNGGDLNEWPPDSDAPITCDLETIIMDLEKSGDPADDQDYLIHNGTKYAVN